MSLFVDPPDKNDDLGIVSFLCYTDVLFYETECWSGHPTSKLITGFGY